MLDREKILQGTRYAINCYEGKHGPVVWKGEKDLAYNFYNNNNSLLITGKTEDNGIFISFRGTVTKVEWGVNLDTAFDHKDSTMDKDAGVQKKPWLIIKLLMTIWGIIKYPWTIIQYLILNFLGLLKNPYGNTESEILMHNGFIDEYRKHVRETVRNFVKENLDASYIMISGHSKGGGIACICYSDIQYYLQDELDKKTDNFLYGVFISMPSVGNDKYVKSLHKRGKNNYISVYIINDPVCAVPPFTMGYQKVRNRRAFSGPLEIIQWPFVRLLWIVSLPLAVISLGRIILLPPLAIWDHFPMRIYKKMLADKRAIREKF